MTGMIGFFLFMLFSVLIFAVVPEIDRWRREDRWRMRCRASDKRQNNKMIFLSIGGVCYTKFTKPRGNIQNWNGIQSRIGMLSEREYSEIIS